VGSRNAEAHWTYEVPSPKDAALRIGELAGVVGVTPSAIKILRTHWSARPPAADTGTVPRLPAWDRRGVALHCQSL